MSVGRNMDKSYTYNIRDTNNQPIALEHSNQFKDLGVLDEKLSLKDHIQDKINKAFSMLGIIKTNMPINFQIGKYVHHHLWVT